MPLHATAHDAVLDDRELSMTAGPGGVSGWFFSLLGRFLPPPNSAVAANPGPATAPWHETPGAARGF